MWPNPQETPDLVTFTIEILNRKLHFLHRVTVSGELFFQKSPSYMIDRVPDPLIAKLIK